MCRKFVEYLGTDIFHFCRILLSTAICCQHVEYNT
jgi:hypothetical protein